MLNALWRLTPTPLRRRWIEAAIVNDNRQQLLAILTRDSWSANLRTRESEPVLILAARLERQEIFDCLLAHGADVQSTDSHGMTALMHCSTKGQLENVDRLLSAGADPSYRDRHGVAALSLAAASGHLEIVALLESKGVELSEFDELLKAIAVDDIEAFRAALGARNRDDAIWPTDAPPLVMAAHLGSVKVMKALLDGGADPNAKTSLESTPLGSAAAAGQQDAVDILLSYGADPDHRDSLGKTARDLAQENGDDKLAAWLSPAHPP